VPKRFLFAWGILFYICLVVCWCASHWSITTSWRPVCRLFPNQAKLYRSGSKSSRSWASTSAGSRVLSCGLSFFRVHVRQAMRWSTVCNICCPLLTDVSAQVQLLMRTMWCKGGWWDLFYFGVYLFLSRTTMSVNVMAHADSNRQPRMQNQGLDEDECPAYYAAVSRRCVIKAYFSLAPLERLCYSHMWHSLCGGSFLHRQCGRCA